LSSAGALATFSSAFTGSSSAIEGFDFDRAALSEAPERFFSWFVSLLFGADLGWFNSALGVSDPSVDESASVAGFFLFPPSPNMFERKSQFPDLGSSSLA
jgi:hypothetical protein